MRPVSRQKNLWDKVRGILLGQAATEQKGLRGWLLYRQQMLKGQIDQYYWILWDRTQARYQV